MPKKQYLGDSVYADTDGFHIVLTTENGLGPSNTIFIDDRVFDALMAYGQNFWQLKNNQSGAV